MTEVEIEEEWEITISDLNDAIWYVNSRLRQGLIGAADIWLRYANERLSMLEALVARDEQTTT